MATELVGGTGLLQQSLRARDLIPSRPVSHTDHNDELVEVTLLVAQRNDVSSMSAYDAVQLRSPRKSGLAHLVLSIANSKTPEPEDRQATSTAGKRAGATTPTKGAVASHRGGSFRVGLLLLRVRGRTKVGDTEQDDVEARLLVLVYYSTLGPAPQDIGLGTPCWIEKSEYEYPSTS